MPLGRVDGEIPGGCKPGRGGGGFGSAWRLALLSVAGIPAIAFAGGLYAYTLTGLTSKSREAYSNAGVVAEQVTIIDSYS